MLAQMMMEHLEHQQIYNISPKHILNWWFIKNFSWRFFNYIINTTTTVKKEMSGGYRFILSGYQFNTK